MASTNGLQEWVFTFGVNHRLTPVGLRGVLLTEDETVGESLAHRYVKIPGTRDEARAVMLKYFGRNWTGQYDADEWLARHRGPLCQHMELKLETEG